MELMVLFGVNDENAIVALEVADEWFLETDPAFLDRKKSECLAPAGKFQRAEIIPIKVDFAKIEAIMKPKGVEAVEGTVGDQAIS